jgi:hypothetical protein
VAGVILSGPNHPRNVAAIRRLGGVPVLGRIPFLDPLNRTTLTAAAAQLDLAPFEAL